MKKISDELAVTVRDRIKSARTLSKLNLENASLLLGYSGKSALWKVETGHRNVTPSIDLVIKCSKLYGVSLDYLFGISDHPEGDPHAIHLKATLRQAEDFLYKHSKKISSELIKFSTHQAPLNLLYSEQAELTGKIVKSFESFKDKNDYDELPAGNPLNKNIELAKKKLQQIQREIAVNGNNHRGYLKMVDDLIDEQPDRQKYSNS